MCSSDLHNDLNHSLKYIIIQDDLILYLPEKTEAKGKIHSKRGKHKTLSDDLILKLLKFSDTSDSHDLKKLDRKTGTVDGITSKLSDTKSDKYFKLESKPKTLLFHNKTYTNRLADHLIIG